MPCKPKINKRKNFRFQTNCELKETNKFYIIQLINKHDLR